MIVSDTQRPPTHCRPREHLAAAGHLYPGAWRAVDALRAQRGQSLPAWPDWCFLPLAGAYAIISGGGDQRVPLHQIGDVARLGALAAWRVTQGIYRFDATLYAAIAATPVSGDLPCDVLYRLPEWCVYIDTPGQAIEGDRLHGFFAHLEWDANLSRTELRLLLDTDAHLLPVPVHLGPWSLDEALHRATDTAQIQAMAHGQAIGTRHLRALRTVIEPLVSLLLYLCSANADIGDGTRRPTMPTPKRTKAGWRLFPADHPAAWDVGVRLGAALRRAYHAADTEHGEIDPTTGRTRPRAHVRRAHWHGYWTGPRDAPEARTLALKWLPPIAVNLDDVDRLPAVLRGVDPA